MININSLGAYINFLHKKRKGTDAPAELIQQWNQIQQSDIDRELKNLYQFWQLTPDQIQTYEAEFQSMQNLNTPPNYQPKPEQVVQNFNHQNSPNPSQIYTPPPPAQNPMQQQHQPLQKKGMSTLSVLLIVIALIIVLPVAGYFGYKYINNPEQVNTEPFQMSEVKSNPSTSTPKKKEVVKSDIDSLSVIDEDDKREKINTINNLIKAEENRDFTSIMNNFSPQIIKYWDLTNPSRERMYNLYESTWAKALDISYNNISVQRITDNIYEMTADYSYYSIKDDDIKSFKIKNRYEFDKNGKINKASGTTVK